MPKQNPLLNIVKKQKEGKAVAIYSCFAQVMHS